MPTAARQLRLDRDRIGSGFVIVLAGISIFLVRRSARARDDAEAQLRDNNLNLEATSTNAPPTCAKPTTRSSASPISSATICARRWSTSWASPANSRNCAKTSSSGSRRSPIPRRGRPMRPTPSRCSKGDDKQLSQDFAEALGFIKSSIAKMDRLISAILNLTREGRREFEPVRIDTAN
jgi:hypothetical protein